VTTWWGGRNSQQPTGWHLGGREGGGRKYANGLEVWVG
jgi:hypothetical protein